MSREWIRGLPFQLRYIFDQELRNAVRAAKTFFRNQHPDRRVIETRLRADEPERFVFALIYMYLAPASTRRPAPYRTVAVTKQTLESAYLESDASSSYGLGPRR